MHFFNAHGRKYKNAGRVNECKRDFGTPGANARMNNDAMSSAAAEVDHGFIGLGSETAMTLQFQLVHRVSVVDFPLLITAPVQIPVDILQTPTPPIRQVLIYTSGIV